MPDIAQVLSHGSTSPRDFTLHDAEHSQRVAKWMVRLLPANLLAALSDYEVALLLLSAYLHDIGMTPEMDKVRRHRDFLLTGRGDLLNADEDTGFQEWLDAAGYGITPPLNGSRALDETVRTADEIITYYTRHRHNDWSEEWIRVHLERERLGTYEGWMADLIRLCRSHHGGYDELAGREFDPRPVGSKAQVVHLRYLAALLRVADVLDVDRERTPEVVFRHRAVAAESKTYWEKDAEITLHLEGGRLSAHARPGRAYLHRAVEETIDGIDRELALCRRLADTTRFEKPIGPGADLPHRWELATTVFRNVEPRDGAYQYIDGAFRPNTRRVLDLLSGTALYGNPLAAIRELLQNAFDAVRELIAYRRLRSSYPADPEAAAKIAQTLHVRLSLEQHDDRLWLVCRDDGTGMTREIIRDALLVSGSPVRPEVLNLERRCRAAGFRLGRTGQFGIGALSYFMLADQVVLTTRRASDSSDAEQNGWWFESSGVGSFGELRADSSMAHGTELRMRMRSELAHDPARLAAEIAQYVRTTLVHIPCNLSFDARPAPDASFRFAPGWTLDEAERTAAVLREFQPSGEEAGYALPEVPSPRYLERVRRHARRWGEIRRTAVETLGWEVEEGELPGGVGSYRLHLPYFNVQGGLTLAFIRPRQESHGLVLRPVSGGDYEMPSAFTMYAWKGMEVRVATARSPNEQVVHAPFGVLISASALLGESEPGGGEWERYGVSAEVDFHSPAVGTLSVARERLNLDQHGSDVTGWLGERARKLVEGLVATHQDSPFTLLSARVAGVTPPAECQLQWGLSRPRVDLSNQRSGSVRWAPLPFPVTRLGVLVDRSGADLPLAWKGRPVSVAVPLVARSHRWSGHAVVWHSREMPPQRVVAVDPPNRRLVPVALWTGPPLRATLAPPLGWRSRFPPEWMHLCATELGRAHEEAVTWNVGNPIVQMGLGATDLQWSDARSSGNSPRTLEAILGTSSMGAAWVLARVAELLAYPRTELSASAWNQVRITSPGVLSRLWTLLFENPLDDAGNWSPITFYRDDYGSSDLVTLTPGGVAVVRLEQGPHGLPRPADPEWVATSL
ncbi:MAG TPA: hypothetical protein VF584_15725 [Longimicrobium sp.]|jgi:hypothetical protein